VERFGCESSFIRETSKPHLCASISRGRTQKGAVFFYPNTSEPLIFSLKQPKKS
jgi:hypothetical protein